MSKIILASSSPRRKELLEFLTLNFKIQSADIDETPKDKETPEELVLRLSCGKANRIAKDNTSSYVIGADTVVSVDNQILGKPVDSEHVKQMLTMLSGKTHQVISGYAIVCQDKGIEVSRYFPADVVFRELTDKEIEEYSNITEPMDKAGSYAFQGVAGKFIESVTGSPTNIIGLNISELNKDLISLGLI